MGQIMKLVAEILLVASVSACVVYPKAGPDHLSKCGRVSRHLELDKIDGDASRCVQERPSCLGALIVIGAATTIVSGSIVIIGNTIFWMEESAECALGGTRQPREPDPDPSKPGGPEELSEAKARST
jgi:hypothetical protein